MVNGATPPEVEIDESLVRGSHGRVERDSPHAPILIADGLDHLPAGSVHVTAVHVAIVPAAQFSCCPTVRRTVYHDST